MSGHKCTCRHRCRTCRPRVRSSSVLTPLITCCLIGPKMGRPFIMFPRMSTVSMKLNMPSYLRVPVNICSSEKHRGDEFPTFEPKLTGGFQRRLRQQASEEKHEWLQHHQRPVRRELLGYQQNGFISRHGFLASSRDFNKRLVFSGPRISPSVRVSARSDFSALSIA